MGYRLGNEDNNLVSHLLFMDDLKLYGTSEEMLDSLIQTVRIFSDDIGMQFGLEKCGILVLERGKVIKSDGIELPNGERMREIDLDGYKYLGILQYDAIQSEAMKKKVKQEYFRRVKKLMRSKLNGGNVILGVNSWAIGIVRYGAGVLDWTKQELRDMDIRTRKIMTMNGNLHPRGNVSRLYLPRKEGGRGLISCEECVENETRNLIKYIRESSEWMLKCVAEFNEYFDQFWNEDWKEETNRTKKQQWHNKPLHGKFWKDTMEVRGDRSWDWLKGGHLKKETEALICAAQEQALATNSVKAEIYEQDVENKCRLCGAPNETVMHIVSGCSVLAGKEYLTRHDQVGKHIHWLLLKKWDIPCTEKWYEHVPQPVVQSGDGQIVITWDLEIKTDRKVGHNKPDILVKNHAEKIWYIIDFAVPMDHRVEIKEAEKVHNYMNLATEVRRQHRVRTKIVPIIMGALGTVPKTLEKSFEILEIPDVTSSLQTAALLGTAAILRRVLNL